MRERRCGLIGKIDVRDWEPAPEVQSIEVRQVSIEFKI
jgi:hypothetical protein